MNNLDIALIACNNPHNGDTPYSKLFVASKIYNY